MAAARDGFGNMFNIFRGPESHQPDQRTLSAVGGAATEGASRQEHPQATAGVSSGETPGDPTQLLNTDSMAGLEGQHVPPEPQLPLHQTK